VIKIPGKIAEQLKQVNGLLNVQDEVLVKLERTLPRIFTMFNFRAIISMRASSCADILSFLSYLMFQVALRP